MLTTNVPSHALLHRSAAPLQKGTPLIKQDPTERLAEKTCVVYLTAVKYQEPQKENDVWQQKAKVALGFRVGGCQETEKFSKSEISLLVQTK